LTWQNADGTENIINVSAEQVADGADPMLFVHAPLVANVPYTYTVTAVAADGTEAVGTPLTESALALGCTPSKYQQEGFVAYYSF
jgi:ABC-type phosphate transport system permease subunit